MFERLTYMHGLRIALIVLVIGHHAAQPYGPTGGAWPVFEDQRSSLLAPFFAVNASFFMGLFFLISAYFTPASVDRKGWFVYLRQRWGKLGVPLVLVTFLLVPLFLFNYSGSAGDGTEFWAYFTTVYIGEWQVEPAHLWFLAHLLVYSTIYALWRALGGPREPVLLPPSNLAIAGYALALALAGSGIRVWYPTDVWVRIAWLIPVEPSHLPQYASLFVLGLIAGRSRWFTSMPWSQARLWLRIGAITAIAYSIC